MISKLSLFSLVISLLSIVFFLPVFFYIPLPFALGLTPVLLPPLLALSGIILGVVGFVRSASRSSKWISAIAVIIGTLFILLFIASVYVFWGFTDA